MAGGSLGGAPGADDAAGPQWSPGLMAGGRQYMGLSTTDPTFRRNGAPA